MGETRFRFGAQRHSAHALPHNRVGTETKRRGAIERSAFPCLIAGSVWGVTLHACNTRKQLEPPPSAEYADPTPTTSIETAVRVAISLVPAVVVCTQIPRNWRMLQASGIDASLCDAVLIVDRMVRGSSSLLGRTGKVAHMQGFFVASALSHLRSGDVGTVKASVRSGLVQNVWPGMARLEGCRAQTQDPTWSSAARGSEDMA